VEKSLTRPGREKPASEIPAQFSKRLMFCDLRVRTGLGANRTATARFGRFSSVSTGISTGFSAGSSENFD
jgi:hypothetical protein